MDVSSKNYSNEIFSETSLIFSPKLRTVIETEKEKQPVSIQKKKERRISWDYIPPPTNVFNPRRTSLNSYSGYTWGCSIELSRKNSTIDIIEKEKILNHVIRKITHKVSENIDENIITIPIDRKESIIEVIFKKNLENSIKTTYDNLCECFSFGNIIDACLESITKLINKSISNIEKEIQRFIEQSKDKPNNPSLINKLEDCLIYDHTDRSELTKDTTIICNKLKLDFYNQMIVSEFVKRINALSHMRELDAIELDYIIESLSKLCNLTTKELITLIDENYHIISHFLPYESSKIKDNVEMYILMKQVTWSYEENRLKKTLSRFITSIRIEIKRKQRKYRDKIFLRNKREIMELIQKIFLDAETFLSKHSSTESYTDKEVKDMIYVELCLLNSAFSSETNDLKSQCTHMGIHFDTLKTVINDLANLKKTNNKDFSPIRKNEPLSKASLVEKLYTDENSFGISSINLKSMIDSIEDEFFHHLEGELIQKGLLEENRFLNRICGNEPLDKNLVPLPDNKYHNASLIFFDTHTCIATQSPIVSFKKESLSTIETHWKMIWENESSTSIILQNFNTIESAENEDFLPYFPNKIKATDTIGEFHIRCKDIQTFLWGKIFSLILWIEGSNNSILTRSHDILLYTEPWDSIDDGAIPREKELFIDFLKKATDIIKDNVCRLGLIGPPIIHCKYGMGRTSIFLLLLDLINKKTEKKEEKDLSHSLKLIISQRGLMMLPTYLQLNFVVDCYDQYLKQTTTIHH